MKAKVIIKQYNLDQIQETTDLREFLKFFFSETIEKEYSMMEPTLTNLKTALSSARKQWDAISCRIAGGLPERYWKYLYASMFVPLRDKEFPESKYKALITKLNQGDHLESLTYNLVSQILDYYKTKGNIEEWVKDTKSEGFTFLVNVFNLHPGMSKFEFDQVCSKYIKFLKKDYENLSVFNKLSKTIKSLITFES